MVEEPPCLSPGAGKLGVFSVGAPNYRTDLKLTSTSEMAFGMPKVLIIPERQLAHAAKPSTPSLDTLAIVLGVGGGKCCSLTDRKPAERPRLRSLGDSKETSRAERLQQA